VTTLSAAAARARHRNAEGSLAPKPPGRAQAELEFACDPSGRTFLRRQHVTYPFHVTRPFYLDPASPCFATLYLQSLSGGLVQGDQLKIAVRVETGAAVLVTTQSATKAHSMERAAAAQSASFEVAAGGYLEYLPDTTILFPRTRVSTAIRLLISEDASAILMDSFLSHDPWSDPPDPFDRYHSAIAIERPDGTLLALDRVCLEGRSLDAKLEAFAGPHLGLCQPAYGTVIVICDKPSVAKLMIILRQVVPEISQAYSGVTTLPSDSGVVTRTVASDGAALKRVLTVTWQLAHQVLTGQTILPRRK